MTILRLVPWRLRRAPLAVATLVVIGALLAACSGGSAKPAAGGTAPSGAANPAAASGSVAPGGDGAAGADAGASRAGWRAPTLLSVVPIQLPFTVSDPKFDAMPGARAIFGENAGAGYEIEVPDSWNGDVVYFAHGFRGNAPELTVQAPPIREYLITHGYAWAASSYSANGYDPGAGARDTYALRDVFAQKVGTPKHSYIYGQSMGGHVTSFSLEQYPTAYDGALAECGVVSGHEVLDYLLSWAALSGYFSGQDLFSLTNDAGKLINVLRNDVGQTLGPPNKLTDKGQAFANVIENLTGGPRPFFREGFVVNYIVNFGLLFQAAAQPAITNAVAQNAATRYAIDDGRTVSSDQLNREVARIAADPKYRDVATHPEFADFTGKIKRPYLTIHGTGDLFVPISLEQSYRRTVDAAGAGDLLVQRAIRRAGHCTFSQDERISAFEDLVNWVEHGKKPAGEDLTASLADAGRAFTQPLLPDDPGGLR